MPDEPAFIATLVSDPARPCLAAGRLAEAVRRVGRGAEPRVLAPGIAADLAIDASGRADAEAALRDLFASDPVDIVVQPVAGRRKRLFLADMDSTMIRQECIDELADFVGLKDEVAGITERAMRGEIAFEPALRERVALLKDLSVSVVSRILADRIAFMPGGRTLVATMRANGAYACLVSGGFTLFTGPVSAELGFDEHRSNRLVLQGERLAGTVEEPILGRQAKLDTLVELRTRLGLAPFDILAVGDGANDLAMLGEAGLGVAFHAKPAVAAVAGARIDHADLTALLYIQGYATDDFVP